MVSNGHALGKIVNIIASAMFTFLVMLLVSVFMPLVIDCSDFVTNFDN